VPQSFKPGAGKAFDYSCAEEMKEWARRAHWCLQQILSMQQLPSGSGSSNAFSGQVTATGVSGPIYWARHSCFIYAGMRVRDLQRSACCSVLPQQARLRDGADAHDSFLHSGRQLRRSVRSFAGLPVSFALQCSSGAAPDQRYAPLSCRAIAHWLQSCGSAGQRSRRAKVDALAGHECAAHCANAQTLSLVAMQTTRLRDAHCTPH
jgi:hypothetical protein